MFSKTFSSTLSTMQEFNNRFELKPYLREPCQQTLRILALIAAAMALGLLVNKVRQRKEIAVEQKSEVIAKPVKHARRPLIYTGYNSEAQFSFATRQPTYAVPVKPAKSCKGRDTTKYSQASRRL